ncbi:(d)CMP kinase [Bartonella tamiae]|uniref:Cytidylate kinase n=1 Tax=Bartonella tamiae Th239 TaxID=1094558 RepID=J0QYM8_9HYPH|nr:(d)CMP kinase [Bartonella tamiae]EJF91216.1 cytidylate kinase [Bartonella tamiae Th239]EJF93119.1 cytidylate kinase [Bartonella tamiae Th307]
MSTFVIAIDGPAASGKGTLARKIADHYHFRYLDTGLTYRAVADVLMRENIALDDEESLVEIAHHLDFSALDRTHLSDHKIGEVASKIAVFKKLRQTLVHLQRQFAQSNDGVVLDGRDIGTVVCPDANVKLYISASAEIRAQRRYKELRSKGFQANYDNILADLKKRDERDMNRIEGPLKPADDAHLLDTTKLSIEAVFEDACLLIDPLYHVVCEI